MAKGKSKSRPQSTSLLSTPSDVTSTSTSSAISSFSPDGSLFAFLTQAIDRHRLRIFNSADGSGVGSDANLLVDYVLPEARCECLCWGKLPRVANAQKDEDTSKRRRKSKGNDPSSSTAATADANGSGSASSQVVLALGLSTGAVHLFSPTQGRVVRILYDEAISASSAASSSITSVDFDAERSVVVACAADGQVRSWSLAQTVADKPAAPTNKIRPDASTPVRMLSLLSNDRLAVAHHSIQVLSGMDSKDSTTLASFTGHASQITHLVSISGPSPRFVSAADGDRIINVWGMPAAGQKEARPLATLALDSTVRQMAAFSTSSSGDAVLVVVTNTGSLRLYDVPASLGGKADQATSNGGVTAGARPRKSVAAVSTLRKLSEVRLLARKGDQESFPVLDAAFNDVGKGVLSIARVVKGAKVTLLTCVCKDPTTGSFVEQVDVLKQGGSTSNSTTFLDDGSQTAQGGGVQAMQKYAEAEVSNSAARKRASQGSSVVGANGMIADANAAAIMADDQAKLDASIEDLEGPTLGSRLKGLDSRKINGVQKPSRRGSDDEEEDSDDEDEEAEASQRRAPLPQGSLSLAQTLVQALHSSDSSLLSSCLAHSDPNVIRQTVRRISGPLAVRLLESCVDRMSVGGKRSKGALAASNSRGIIEWVRATLTAHTSYLMSLPDLVHRLAQLHSMLSHRLSSHERLLLLHGRLELVLSQIEMRTAYAAEQRVAQGTAKSISGLKSKGRGPAPAAEKKKERRWVEASDDEDEDEDEEMDDLAAQEGDEVDVARGEGDSDEEEEEEDDGEVQDIALGMGDETGVTSHDSEEDDDEEEEEEDDDVDIDDEMDDAEEDDDEDEEDESELEEESDDEEEEEDSEEEQRGGLKARSKGLIDDEAEESDEDDDGSEEEEA